MQVVVSLTIEIEASAGIATMEEQIQDAGQQAMRQAMKQAVRRWEDEHQTCWHCGEKQAALEGTTRRVIATCFGRVQVPRRRFRCLACGRRFCPATRLFAGLKGATVTPALQEAARLAGCSWPYRVAARLLARLSGACISAEEIRLLTNREGKQRAQRQQEEAEQEYVSASSDPLARSSAAQPMLVGLDGGWVCSREQRGGMEGKVAVVSSQMEDLPLPVFDTTFSLSANEVGRGNRQDRGIGC